MTQHANFATVKETDATITVGSVAYDALHRNRLEYDRARLLDQALRAFRLNPLARRIVKLYRYFAIGTDVEIEIKGKPTSFFRRFFNVDKLTRTQKFVFEFWNHPINRLDEQIQEWFDERTLTGELYLLFSVDDSGMCLIRAVPSESITKISTKDNDYRQETTYHTGDMDDKAYPAYDPANVGAAAAGSVAPFMRHYVINRPVGSTWGESDLFPLLPWIARYTGWLENRATLNYWRQIFVWMVKGKYASAEERSARQKEIEAHPPRPGSILVGDESESWECIAPQLDSFEANADGLAIKKQIAAGAGIPMHFLAEPESSTRTTAEAAGTPAFKNFADYQASFFNILKDVVEIACSIRRLYDENILTHPEVDVHGQDISERDNPNLSLSFQRAIQAAGELYDRKMIDTKEMLRLSWQFGGMQFDESEERAEGLRRPLSQKSKTPTTPTPSPKTDSETGDVIEQPEP